MAYNSIKQRLENNNTIILDGAIGAELEKKGAKMQKLDKIKEVKVAEQSIEVDPRSKTTADQAFNYIATGKPETPVGGQKRMLAEKKRNSKAY